MKQIFVALTVAAVVLSSAAPTALAATEIGNVGNGVESTNNATVNQTNSTSVSQTNAATINNNLSVTSNTGGNESNRNTGGDNEIVTGGSGVAVSVENVANQNLATVNNCCVTLGSTSVSNQGNGDSTENTAVLNQANTTALSQTNVADIANVVAVDSSTGNNQANRNTGGDTFIKSGASIVSPISISNAANSNRAAVGSPAGASGLAGGLTIGNGGNGVESDNVAVANVSSSQLATQLNDANVLNYVDIASNTGYNTANRNTGGEVEIWTGGSAVGVELATDVNSNAAWLDNCGCVGLGGATVKNLGNGDSSESDAVLNKYNASAAYQANLSDVNNVGYFDSNTGYNKAKRNTGAVGAYSDPYIQTGVGVTEVAASTAANQNMLNSGSVAMPMPTAGANGSWWYAMGYNYAH